MFARCKFAYANVLLVLVIFTLGAVMAQEEVEAPEETVTDEEENVDETLTVDADDLEVEPKSDSAAVEVLPEEESFPETTEEPERESEETKDEEISDVFTPSESVSEDNPVAFPRDI